MAWDSRNWMKDIGFNAKARSSKDAKRAGRSFGFSSMLTAQVDHSVCAFDRFYVPVEEGGVPDVRTVHG